MNSIVAVLAGGQSRRMGRDKAAIVINGESMLRKICITADAAGLPVIVVGRSDSDLPPDLHGLVRAVPDDEKLLGPLGGLSTALRVGAGSDVILCGCDMPQITTECFTWLLNEAQAAMETGTAQAIVSRIDGREQPLFSWYSGDLSPVVSGQLEIGQLAMRQLLLRLELRLVDVPRHLVSAVQDLDTPEDLRKLNEAGRTGL